MDLLAAIVACSPFYAALAWDIHELSSYGWPGTSEWMNQSDYAPPCCTPKKCHNTVEADGQCYYAGSVNYILLGVMARLCGKYNQAEIIFAVAFKKLLDGSSAELRETETDWAFQGYHGWPNSGRPIVPGNRPRCLPQCPIKYKSGPFMAVWVFAQH